MTLAARCPANNLAQSMTSISASGYLIWVSRIPSTQSLGFKGISRQIRGLTFSDDVPSEWPRTLSTALLP